MDEALARYGGRLARRVAAVETEIEHQLNTTRRVRRARRADRTPGRRRLKRICERCERKKYIVADLAGITPGMLSRYELGRSCPKLKTLDRLLAVLGCTLEELSRSARRARAGRAKC
jgi:hypothetical protein